MKGMCGKCKKREICKKLCDICETYANQDHISQQELIGAFPTDDNIKEIAEWDDINFDNPKILKTIILKLYFDDNKTVSDISKMLPFSKRHIFRIISKYKKGDTKMKSYP